MHSRTITAPLLLSALFSDTRTITRLSVNDTGYELYNASHWIEQADIRPGVPLYGDNENLPSADRATIATLPDTLVSADWIQPSARSAAFIKSPCFGDTLAAFELREDATICIAHSDTILRASPSPADYPPKHATVPGFRSHEPYQFIFAQNAKNITITGGGIIDGYALREGYPWGGRNNEHERPRLIRMFSRQNIRVENITLIRSANWTQYYESCTDMVFRHLRIRCHTGVNNQDGIDISGCSNVLIDDFHATTGDDAICIKALTLTPAENIRINNLYSPYTNCNILKIGTETHGAIKNLHATNIEGVARYSLAIETVDGSILENITCENATLYGCGAPIFVRLGARGRTFEGGPKPAPPGALRNIRNYANTWGAEKRGLGLGSSCAGVKNLRIQNLIIEDCDLFFHGAQTDPKVVTREIPENADKYPDYPIFGVCPAYGLCLRHIDGLTLRDNRIRSTNTDIRPPIVLEDVLNATLTGNTLQTFAITRQ